MLIALTSDESTDPVEFRFGDIALAVFEKMKNMARAKTVTANPLL
jgi:hypothetical protein